MREEVCDQKQLLRAFPLPQMMLPEADPQVPVRTDFRGQAGDRRLSPPKVLYAPPQPHPLRGSAPCSLLSEISCLLPHPTWGLSGDLGPLEPCGCIGTHLPHKNNHKQTLEVHGGSFQSFSLRTHSSSAKSRSPGPSLSSSDPVVLFNPPPSDPSF